MNNVILVDTDDHQIGVCEKLAAHQQGLLHRAFSIFVFREADDGQLEVLLQQRAADKYHSAGLWSNACCSHPKPGETVLTAARRRLQEEFGFCTPLKQVGSFIYNATLDHGMTEYEYDHVLVGMFDDETIQPNPEEISNYQWVNIKKLIASVNKQPKLYTAWLKEAFTLTLEHKAILLEWAKISQIA